MNSIKELFQKAKKLFINNKFSQDTFYNYLSTILLAFTGIIINIVLGNKYGADGVGIFNQSFAVFTLLSIVAVLGMQSSVLKYVSEFVEQKDEINKITTSAILVAVPFSLILTIAIILLCLVNPSIFFNADVTFATKLIIIGLPFFTLNKLLMALLNGLRKMKIYALNQSARWIMMLVFVVACVLLDFPVYYTVLCIPISECIIAIWMLFYTRHLFNITSKRSIIWMKKHLHFGLKTLLISITSETNKKTDILLLGFFMNNYDVGIYSFASTIVKGLLMFTGTVQVNINPIVSNLWASNQKEKLEKYVKQIVKVMLIIVLPSVSLVGIAYPFLLKIFMKNTNFGESIVVFYILLAGIILPAIYYFAGAFLAMANFLTTSLKSVLLILGFNIITTIILVLSFGLIGAAISTSLTYMFSVLLMYYFIKDKMKIRLMF